MRTHAEDRRREAGQLHAARRAPLPPSKAREGLVHRRAPFHARLVTQCPRYRLDAKKRLLQYSVKAWLYHCNRPFITVSAIKLSDTLAPPPTLSTWSLGCGAWKGRGAGGREQGGEGQRRRRLRRRVDMTLGIAECILV